MRYVIFLMLFANISTFSESKLDRFTPTHILGLDINEFKNNNKYYEYKDGYLYRTKPENAGNIWSYDLIKIGADKTGMVDKMIFRLYDRSDVIYIKNKDQFKKRIRKQFNFDKYGVNKIDSNKSIKIYLKENMFFNDILNVSEEIDLDMVFVDGKFLVVFFQNDDSSFLLLVKFENDFYDSVVETNSVVLDSDQLEEKDVSVDVREIQNEIELTQDSIILIAAVKEDESGDVSSNNFSDILVEENYDEFANNQKLISEINHYIEKINSFNNVYTDEKRDIAFSKFKNDSVIDHQLLFFVVIELINKITVDSTQKNQLLLSAVNGINKVQRYFNKTFSSNPVFNDAINKQLTISDILSGVDSVDFMSNFSLVNSIIPLYNEFLQVVQKCEVIENEIEMLINSDNFKMTVEFLRDISNIVLDDILNEEEFIGKLLSSKQMFINNNLFYEGLKTNFSSEIINITETQIQIGLKYLEMIKIAENKGNINEILRNMYYSDKYYKDFLSELNKFYGVK